MPDPNAELSPEIIAMIKEHEALSSPSPEEIQKRKAMLASNITEDFDGVRLTKIAAERLEAHVKQSRLPVIDPLEVLGDAVESAEGLERSEKIADDVGDTAIKLQSALETLGDAVDLEETLDRVFDEQSLVWDGGPEGDPRLVIDGENLDKHPRININIRLLPHHEGLDLPEYKTSLASGMDLIAAIDAPVYLNSIGATVVIPTGIMMEIPVGYEGQVRPRSGLAAKNSITVTNTPGTIDADYRGEIKVLLTNLGGRRFMVERGMRIAQLVITPVVQADLNLVGELSETERGEDGHGSTGVM